MRDSLSQAKKDQQNIIALSGMVEVYGQVAASNLKDVKTDVINSRDFMEGLRAMFQEIKSAWEKRHLASTVLPPNGKEVAVFVSANLGFYGDIVEKTYEQFAQFIQTNSSAEIVVLGREGKKMVKNRMANKQFDFFDFPDDAMNETSLKELVEKIKAFEKVRIFHGRYVSTITQEAVATQLEGTALKVIDYIFEPNPESIVQLFEGEILSSVIEQAIREGQLSKFAARIMHLGNAMEKIEAKQFQLKLKRRRLIQDEFNKKQRTRLVSVRLLMRQS